VNLNSPLFLICSLAGLLLVSGSLFLLWKGVIDLKPGQAVTEMQVGNATIKTPVPTVFMFALGVLMVVFPVYKSPDKALEIVKLRGRVSTDTDVEVNAVVDQREAHASNDFDLSVPYLENRRYLVRYLDKSGSELDKESFTLGPGETVYDLRGLRFKAPVPAAKSAAPTADPAVASQIPLVQKEPSDTVNEFKTQ
jgi:hypothetical protein